MRARYDKVKELSSQQAAYLAGIVDGEGTITLTRRNIYKQRYLALTVSNNELPLLKYILRTAGVGKITRKLMHNPNHATGYTYQVFSRQALDLVRIILPYLRTYKQKRAKFILKHYLKLTPRNGKYTPRMFERRDKFIREFFTLMPENAPKHRGGFALKL